MWHTQNKSKLCPSLWLHTTTKWEERIVKRVLIQHRNQQTWAESWVEIETAGITGVALLGIFGLGVYAFVAYEWKSNFFVDQWHVWVYVRGLLLDGTYKVMAFIWCCSLQLCCIWSIWWGLSKKYTYILAGLHLVFGRRVFHKLKF